jgi:hypothetical protein
MSRYPGWQTYHGAKRTNTPKYHNIPEVINGIRFASRKEARRYVTLTLLQRAGEIRDLEADKRKLRYPLVVNGVKIAVYECDYRYVTRAGALVIEDAKGVRTPVYTLKKRLMKALYDIDIYET